MKLPDMERFYIDDLAQRWGVAPERVEHLLEEGILKAIRGKNNFPDKSIERQKEFVRACRILPEVGPVFGGKCHVVAHYMGRVGIELAEVLRFEEENTLTLPVNLNNSDAQTIEETDKDLAERLKLQCLPNKAIARAFKLKFPSLTCFKIYKLVLEPPEMANHNYDQYQYDAARKKGERLLI